MWNTISVLLLFIELALLAGFVIGKFRQKKLNETFLFLGLVFLINLALYLVPYLYSVIVLKEEGNWVLEVLNRIMGAIQLFLGNVETDAVADFAEAVPVFAYTYIVGALLALLATVSAAVEAFSHTLINSFRLSHALKQDVCDIVVGSGAMAQHYVKNNPNTVILLDNSVEKNTAVALMEKGCTVLRRDLSVEFLSSRYLNNKTRYNIICPNEREAYFDYLDVFITFRRSDCHGKNIGLYVEVNEQKAETIRREIIEKSGFEECITTFCSNELMARTFVEAHPVTEHLPQDFISADTSIRPERSIHVYLLGFGPLSRELYRQSVMNNQLVTFRDGEYRVFPVQYHIYDPKAEENLWEIGGLKKALDDLRKEAQRYFPLPELPYETQIIRQEPHFRDTLSQIVRQIRTPDSFSCCIVDTGDPFRNIETGTRLRSMLSGSDHFHIYIRSATPYTRDDDQITYYGDFNKIFSHDVIVNDTLSSMAKKINEVYTGDAEKAGQQWKQMDCFTLYSNLYSAVNLRLKLNLLGLNYVKDGRGAHTGLIHDKYPRQETYGYQDYFTSSRRNALLAQEHARWNAYHLLNEYLPLEKEGITVRSVDGETVRFHTKNLPAKKHACLTTFRGLDQLSCSLAKQAQQITGAPHGPECYDYYIYDEMLIRSAEELMTRLGYSIEEKI